MKIIDAHSHINYISCSLQPDVVGTVCCTTNESQWDDLINIMNQNDCVYGAFGVHPWFVDDIETEFDLRLEKLLSRNNRFMVGEIGLDKYKPNMEIQIDVFKRQFDIAVIYKRPVFLHCVGAWDKILNILKQYKKSELPLIVVHDFHGSKEIIEYLLDNYNVIFSFGKNAVYGENSRIQKIPLHKIMVESDGKNSVLLKEVVNKISEIKQCINASEIIYQNTERVLKNE